MNRNIIIVTGVSGYIGGQTAIQLHSQGYRVVGIDLLPLPEHLQTYVGQFVQTDFASNRSLEMLASEEVLAVVHCAGTSLVGPSHDNPREYFHNNTAKTLAMLDALLFLENRPRVIYSSSAAVYGDPVMTPCFEVDPTAPISPYGQSKLMAEWFLQSYAQAYGLDFVTFRYFNAAGADPEARHGQETGASHIIAKLLESVRDNTEFTCYGKDYNTADGTCLRDYVHVADIARAHVAAIDPSVPCGIYNLGVNKMHSNQEVIDAVSKITGKNVNVVYGDRRTGDPEKLCADSSLFAKVGNWQPEYTLADMITHAWAWYNKKLA